MTDNEDALVQSAIIGVQATCIRYKLDEGKVWAAIKAHIEAREARAKQLDLSSSVHAAVNGS